MSRNNRHGHNRHSWNNNNNQNNQQRDIKSVAPMYPHTFHEDPAEAAKRDQAIIDLKKREVICEKCGQPITDVASAIADKVSGKPVHFECVLNELAKGETLGENDRIAYIGQGRFAVLHYDNPRDQKGFKILKIIEWEPREQKREWRDELSGLYSQVL